MAITAAVLDGECDDAPQQQQRLQDTRRFFHVVVLALSAVAVYQLTADSRPSPVILSQTSQDPADSTNSNTSVVLVEWKRTNYAPSRPRRTRSKTVPLEEVPTVDDGAEARWAVGNVSTADLQSGRRGIVANDDSNCSFVVDNASPSTDIQWWHNTTSWRRRCGSVVTRRSLAIPGNVSDPMLECQYFTSAMYAFSMNKYVSAQPTARIRRRGSDLVHHLWSDFGCFTTYAIEQPVLFGTGAPHIGVAAATIVSTCRLLDVGSTVLVQRWRQHELDLSRLNDDIFQVRHHLCSRALVVQRALESADPTAALAPHQIDFIRGDVVMLSSRYVGAGLIGQTFQEFITYVARLFTSGLLDMKNLTLVLQHVSHAPDEAFRAWLYPYLPSHVRLVHLTNQRVVLAERPHFVTVSGTEAVEPCHGLFITYYLLPRVLRVLRRDRAFQFGDQAVRKSANRTDMEWLATLPKKIAIIKDNAHSRHLRGWTMKAEARRLLELSGFTIIPDDAPFDHRIALINAADVVVTTWGALVAMMSRLYGGPSFRPHRPLRMIVLVHPGYSNERGWNAIRRARLGKQSGVEVLISDTSALTPLGAWVKYVFAKDGGDLQQTITPALLSFRAEDCTFTPKEAKDFSPSRYVDGTPYANDRPFSDMRPGWRFLRKYGYGCPLPKD